ncbi:hypothetical protein FEM48_Zijuj02G0163200 [Ziziphus jujuba var. spinosa]|uniref:NADP-dependent oxidoreductase domain-containing protein n=1 Tax=Ziziphus jujuba var. spinosa TaxID=714518 RepID=A0A978VWP3_ZIZJJ|nr:hypothetical protein FEM48_Zijuj02G0163200 [Ziziphus jujuba var. spinosa]
MAEDQRVVIPRVKLGNQGFQVSKLGFGCLGLTGFYNSPVPEEVGISIIKYAFNKGITFFDTSDFYGENHANEVLIGKALKHLPRDEVQIATKFGIVKVDSNKVVVNGKPEYVRRCFEGSLERIGLEYIDLYYQHRIDTTVPIEHTPVQTLRRAHAVHPITALQMEWSLWTREIEEEIVPLCRELGIGIVPYSPLGRGFFGGKKITGSVSSNSFLESLPRFQGENLEKNKNLYARIEKLAEKHRCTPAQLALSWVLHQGDDVVPIPGTTKIENLNSNIGSLGVTLSEEDIKEVSDLISIKEVAGDRTTDYYLRCSWKFANTPPKDGKTPS